MYALEPVGIGTAMSESLSSYLIRLAEAHSVGVGDFVGRLLLDIPNPKGAIVTQAALASREGSHGFRACGYAINGTTDRTATWVYALEAATGRCDLRHLTLLSLRSALPQQIFRRNRAWCPACFEHWRATGEAIYEPLRWTFELSTCCTIHKRSLCNTCPHCDWRLKPIGVFSRIGFCQHCGEWLGRFIGDAEPAQDSTASERKLWASEQIGKLVGILPQMDPETARKYFRGCLTFYLEEVLHGNVGALAEYIHCPRSILQSWLNGRRMPRLDSLLRISQALNVSVASLFIREKPTSIDVTIAKQAVTIAGQRSVSPSRNGDAIRKELRRAFSEDTPISLSDVARRLGYTTTERLYQADRKLCHRISARYRSSH